MSAQKRRNILAGFGAVAVVLAGAVAYFGPSFDYRDADASGAIGAVEKHRAPQITESDVVLGDEATKKEQQILYADFLADASALQNISADLQAAESLEARQRAISQLGVRQAALQVRYFNAAAETLNALKQLGAEEQLGRAAFQNLEAAFREEQMGVMAMYARHAELASAIQQLGAAACCAHALNVRALQNFENALASADAGSLGRMADVEQLRAAFEADALGARVQARAAYLDAMASEAATLDAVSRALQAKSLDSRKLASFSADLMAAADQLEARARGNMEQNLAHQAATLNVIAMMGSRLNAASNSLDAASRSALASFTQDLQSRSRNLNARANLQAREQLAAVQRHLSARNQLGTRAHLASMSESSLAAFAQELAARAH